MASDLDKRYVDNVNWRLDDQIRFFAWPDIICPQVLPADILREQSVVDKEIIFRDFLPLQELQLAKGRALLQKLHNIAPSIATNFELKKDFVENFSFRLINGASTFVEISAMVNHFKFRTFQVIYIAFIVLTTIYSFQMMNSAYRGAVLKEFWSSH
jgi:hypothetical protein